MQINNLCLQSDEQVRLKPMIEEAITELCISLPSRMVIADLGCSCGPNALSLVSMAVDAVCRQYLELEQPPPELSLLLNDLPSNDFNTVVNHLVAFRKKHNGASVTPLVFTSVVPGSFYERLFTTASMHLVLSSSSLHWLSQVWVLVSFYTTTQALFTVFRSKLSFLITT